MASWLLLSIGAFLILHMVGDRFQLRGQVKAAIAVDWLATAMAILLPVALTLGLLVEAPGYLQSVAASQAGIRMTVGAILAQIAGNFLIKKTVEIAIKRTVGIFIEKIVDIKV